MAADPARLCLMVDECVPIALFYALESDGYDVVLSPKRSRSFKDPELLAASAKQGRILITTDAHITGHLQKRVAAGKDHPGILLGLQQPIGGLIRRTRQKLKRLDPKTIRNAGVWV